MHFMSVDILGSRSGKLLDLETFTDMLKCIRNPIRFGFCDSCLGNNFLRIKIIRNSYKL